jgi:hypothetical protein
MQRRFWDIDRNLLHYALKRKKQGIFVILKRVLEKWTRNYCPFLKMDPTFFLEGQRIFIYKNTLILL